MLVDHILDVGCKGGPNFPLIIFCLRDLITISQTSELVEETGLAC